MYGFKTPFSCDRSEKSYRLRHAMSLLLVLPAGASAHDVGLAVMVFVGAQVLPCWAAGFIVGATGFLKNRPIYTPLAWGAALCPVFMAFSVLAFDARGGVGLGDWLIMSFLGIVFLVIGCICGKIAGWVFQVCLETVKQFSSRRSSRD